MNPSPIERPTHLAFVFSNEAWYFEKAGRLPAPYTAEVILSASYGDGSVDGGEVSLRWQELGGKSVPSLHAFDDGWRFLADNPALITWLGTWAERAPSPQQVIRDLLALGFVDETARVNPYAAAITPA